MNLNSGKVLAIDYGTSRVGIAISDPFREIAFPRVTFLNDSKLLQNLRQLIEEEGVKEILIGLPYQTDHSKTKQTMLVEEFIEEMSEILKDLEVKIIARDEKLTTFDAQELVENSLDKKQIAADKDQLAAMIILKEYLAELD